MINASGSLIRATILDYGILQCHPTSVLGQKSSTGAIVLKFGTELVQYVFYIEQKKVMGV